MTGQNATLPSGQGIQAPETAKGPATHLISARRIQQLFPERPCPRSRMGSTLGQNMNTSGPTAAPDVSTVSEWLNTNVFIAILVVLGVVLLALCLVCWAVWRSRIQGSTDVRQAEITVSLGGGLECPDRPVIKISTGQRHATKLVTKLINAGWGPVEHVGSAPESGTPGGPRHPKAPESRVTPSQVQCQNEQEDSYDKAGPSTQGGALRRVD
ncbi:uncharacterized protein LOC125728235 isoform X2 [Brienomyrus brachyistius]|uniref:uncharacterized protein LOC125724900 isoform X2 n=1 Tax=Brienomyrus brachyistius TaxID=42636 RepID=UPI0020B3B4FE|nr:uncharacterized protein LOC125724900 isoform X2 [Brienomyrus brachyistius]XP_048861240.1 uncharacterized protein LOC125728235 isoform X2 [Brienomyrus brachyistius]